MFVLNCKLGKSKRRLALCAAGCAALAVLFAAGVTVSGGKSADSATCDELGVYSVVAETEKQREEFLERFGLKPTALLSTQGVTVPFEFNEFYTAYNELQRSVGLDLERYRGQSAEKLTYQLESDRARYAVLLLSGGRVIGGHLTNGEYGDEMLPLNG